MAETTRQKLARINALLESGVTSTSVDGVTTAFDLKSLRREKQRLEQELGLKRKRTRVITPDMSRR